MTGAVVIEALRTPRGAARESGALHSVTPMELLAGALRALQQRMGLDTGLVADGVFGCVTQTGEQGGNIGKSACLLAGWSPHLRAVTINRYCALGLSAVNWASQQARDGANLTVADIDLWEVRDSFAAITLHYLRSLGIDLERFNVNGSSIALGHPMGATGAMLVSCLLDEMELRGLRYGVAALPGAFGVATATVFERIAT